MNRLRSAWLAMRDSLWFLPTLITLASLGGALLLIEAQGWIDPVLQERWPRLLGASAEGSRALLAAIATSMITVAGVVFSITVVALSLASSQYSPRVLRSFRSDRTTQVVFGVLLGIFAYCLVVLRTLRGPGDGNFIPTLAVLGGIAYAFAGVGLLIYFIHRVAESIQASSIVARIARDTLEAAERLFPTDIAEPDDNDSGRAQLPTAWASVKAPCSGYVTDVDGERLVAYAADSGRVVHLLPAIGEFVIEGAVLAELGGAEPADNEAVTLICGSVSFGNQRTVDQDAAFGVQQLVDVAVRALSPGINDPTTACACIDRLAQILVRVADRPPPQARRLRDGSLCLIAHPTGFVALFELAFAAIVQHSRGDTQVLQHVLDAVRQVERVAKRSERRAALAAMVRAVLLELRQVRPAYRTRKARDRARALQRLLSRPAAERAP